MTGLCTLGHGGNSAAELERLGLAPRPVLDFSVNLSPLGIPGSLRSAMPGILERLGRYPTIFGDGVAAYYRERFGLDSRCVLPTNGASQAIYLALGALGGESVAILSPTFSEYERAAAAAGKSVLHVSLSETDGFSPPDVDALIDAMGDADGLVLCNPNNPTGTRRSAEALLHLSGLCPNKLFIIDESFVQFLDDEDAISLLRMPYLRPNLVIVHSLTKLYAVPGLRLGAVVSHPHIIARLKTSIPPWSVNALAEAAASLLAESTAYEDAVRRSVSGERARMLSELAEIAGVSLHDTGVNFLLAKWTKTPNLDDLLRALLTQGIYVRDCRNFRGLEDNWFRFAVRLPQENNRLIGALKAAANG